MPVQIWNVNQERFAMPMLGEFGAGLLHQQTKALVQWHGAVIDDRDPEPLHQMRVSMRRLRTSLDQFGPALILPKGVNAERVSKALRRLGMARDLDVLGHRLKQELLPRLPQAEAKQLKPVLKQLRRERQLAHGSVVNTLQSSSYLAMVSQLQRWLKDPQLSAWGEAPLHAWLVEIQLPVMGELFLHPGWLVAELDNQAEAIHGLRIAIKHARYGLENVSSVSGSGTRRWIQRFKAAQDVLGELNDGEVLRRAIDSQIPQGLELAMPHLHGLLVQQSELGWQQWRHQARSLNTWRQRRSLLEALLSDQVRMCPGIRRVVPWVIARGWVASISSRWLSL